MIFGKVDLTKDNISSSLIIFAIPIFISNIFQQLYVTADTMVVGHYLGEEALAAMGAALAVNDLLVGFGIGVGVGMSIVIARFYGANEELSFKRSIAGSIVIGAAFSAVIMLISFFGLYPLLRLLNTPENIIQDSHSYLIVLTMGVSVLLAYNLLAGWLRAIGNSFMPLVFLIIAAALNVVLDILFVAGFGMGVDGTAVATVIAQGISAILCIFYIKSKNTILIPKKEHFAAGLPVYKELAGQGFSMGFMLAIVSSGTVVLQRAINDFGYLVIAGHTTARRINAFVMMPCATVGSALATFVSQNRGAGKVDRIKEGVKVGCKLTFGWAVIATALIFLSSRFLVTLISGSTDDVILSNASLYLRFNTPFAVVLGVLLIMRNSLQGLGEKIIPLVSSVIELVGKILFAWLLIPHMGYWGVIICEPLIWVAMTAQLLYAYRRNGFLYPRKKKVQPH